MKNILISIAFVCVAFYAQAQKIVQNGQVRLQNSKYETGKTEYVGGVQIKFDGSVATTSDNAGKFNLVFLDKKRGDLIFMEQIRKEGYELVNKKAFEYNKISLSDSLGTDIILAKAGKLETAKREYYAISDKQLKAAYDRKRQDVEKQLNQKQLSNEKYAQTIKDLWDEYEKQQKSLDDLSSRFAEVNFDDVSTEYRQALESFKAGKIDQALAILEGTNPAAKVVKHLKEEERIRKEGKELAVWQEQNQESFTKNLDLIQLNGELYVLNGQRDKAEALYLGLYALDSTDLRILQPTGDFFNKNHYYENALQIYSNIIKHPKVEDWEVIIAYNNMGNAYLSIGKITKAIKAYEYYSELCSAKVNKKDIDNSERYKYYDALLISYEKLGISYLEIGNEDKALLTFEKGQIICENLSKNYPERNDFKYWLASSYQLLASVYLRNNKFTETIYFAKKQREISKKLFEMDSTNINYNSILASAYQFLSRTFLIIGKKTEVLNISFKFYQQMQKLCLLKPLSIEYKDGFSISCDLMSDTFFSLGYLKESLVFREQENQLRKELYENYPMNVHFVSNLAISHMKLGMNYLEEDTIKANNYFEQANKLSTDLVIKYSENTELQEKMKQLRITILIFRELYKK